MTPDRTAPTLAAHPRTARVLSARTFLLPWLRTMAHSRPGRRLFHTRPQAGGSACMTLLLFRNIPGESGNVRISGRGQRPLPGQPQRTC